ncbi:MAG: tyrosine-type recombinase/integrase [Alphaproteobacteria bacterium]
MPITKLTKSNIDKIPFTKTGQVLYHDENLKGFMLRVGMNTKTYCVYNTINGRNKQITIGRHGVFTPEQARKSAQAKLLQMAQGVDPDEALKKSAHRQITLLEIVDDFLAVRTQLKPNTQKDYKYFILKYLHDWANKPAADITEKMILDRYLYIGKNSGHATANNVRRYLGSLLNYATLAHKLFDQNPVSIIAKTRSTFPDKRKTNVINPKDLPIWWQAVEDLEGHIMTDYLKLVLLTGLRRSEAAKLKWSDIDFNNETLTISETKNGQSLSVPIGKYLHSLLQKRREKVTGDWVFPSSSKTGHLSEPKKAARIVRNACGVDFTIHDLRRTYMTIAASLDISVYALKRLVNHKTSHDVTGGYIVLGIEQLREPVQKIENYILESIYDRRKK